MNAMTEQHELGGEPEDVEDLDLPIEGDEVIIEIGDVDDAPAADSEIQPIVDPKPEPSLVSRLPCCTHQVVTRLLPALRP